MVAARTSNGSDIDPTVDAAPAEGWRRWIRELGTHEQARLAQFGAIVAAGFIAAIVLLYAFVWLADQVLDQETRAIDLATLTLMQHYASPQLTLAAQYISLFGNEAIWVLTAVLLVVFGWQRRWGAAGTLILIAGGSQILNSVLKSSFHRIRPEPLVGFISAQSYSFPSGHAMVSAAFYLYVGYLAWRFVHGWWRGVLIAGLVILVLLIGLSRLYLQVHYLSDVVAGYLGGVLWADAVILGGRVLRIRHRTMRRTTAQPARP